MVFVVLLLLLLLSLLLLLLLLLLSLLLLLLFFGFCCWNRPEGMRHSSVMQTQDTLVQQKSLPRAKSKRKTISKNRSNRIISIRISIRPISRTLRK